MWIFVVAAVGFAAGVGLTIKSYRDAKHASYFFLREEAALRVKRLLFVLVPLLVVSVFLGLRLFGSSGGSPVPSLVVGPNPSTTPAAVALGTNDAPVSAINASATSTLAPAATAATAVTPTAGTTDTPTAPSAVPEATAAVTPTQSISPVAPETPAPAVVPNELPTLTPQDATPAAETPAATAASVPAATEPATATPTTAAPATGAATTVPATLPAETLPAETPVAAPLTPSVVAPASTASTAALTTTAPVSGTVTATPTPTVTDTPVVGRSTPRPNATMGPVVLSRTLIGKRPKDPSIVFATGPGNLYAFFEYENMTNGVAWSHRWFRGSTQVGGESLIWNWGSEGTAHVFVSLVGYTPGQYELRLFIGDQLKATHRFEMR